MYHANIYIYIHTFERGKVRSEDVSRKYEMKMQSFLTANSLRHANRFIANGRKLFRDAITMIYYRKVLVRECHRRREHK